MASAAPHAKLRVTPAFVRATLVTAAICLYVWLRIDPSLLYYWPEPSFPAFLRGLAFLAPFLARRFLQTLGYLFFHFVVVSHSIPGPAPGQRWLV